MALFTRPLTRGARGSELRHDYPFDPSYGYDLDGLLAIEAPPEPVGFAEFWSARYERALAVDPAPRVKPSSYRRPGWRIWDLEYTSTDGFAIRGWLLEPGRGPVRGGIIVGHGYGGLERPDFALPRLDAAYLVPCFRGLGRSGSTAISSDPNWHVLHDIHSRDTYVIGGCVEDLWTAVTAFAVLRPELEGRLGYMGTSFGGGIGALGLPWERRLDRAHLDVPTFGHQPLRVTLPTCGSAHAVQGLYRRNRDISETLAFYDSAVAARRIGKPVHVAAALFDPVVVPPGQFAVYNALPGPKELFVRRAGHFEHPGRAAEDRKLRSELQRFFIRHEPRIPRLAQPVP
jgi:cephalosporin-C deacetylase